MAKRSDFPRRDRDFYPTPESAVIPLIPHLSPKLTYWEPCAGEGHLITALAKHWDGVCVDASDRWAEDRLGPIVADDLFDRTSTVADVIITNPPWPQRKGQPTIDMIHHLATMKPTWLLLSSDFAHNAYFNGVAPLCDKIVSVGRVSWMENGVSGKDNAAWYRFTKNHIGATRFFGRAA